jgi:hypothetical protein
VCGLEKYRDTLKLRQQNQREKQKERENKRERNKNKNKNKNCKTAGARLIANEVGDDDGMPAGGWVVPKRESCCGRNTEPLTAAVRKVWTSHQSG